MLQDVDETLLRLLAEELANIPGCPVWNREQITFEPPNGAEAGQDGEARINLCLHDIRENMEMREEGLQFSRKTDEGTAGTRWLPIRLDLSYLVTAHAGNDLAAEHRLLADVLGVLLRYLAAPAKYLVGSLESLGAGTVLLKAARGNPTGQDPASLWHSLSGKTRPALSLVVTAPFDPFETKWTKVVREAVLAIGQGTSNRSPGRPIDVSDVRVTAAGVVVDAKTEIIVPNVTVGVDGRAETVQTDDRGFFHILNLPPGPNRLAFAKRGYQRQEKELVVPNRGGADSWQPLVLALRPLEDAEQALEDAILAAEARNTPALVESGRQVQVSVTGRLRFFNGRPAAFIPVRAGRKQTVTDADGVYCFFDLPPGNTTVFAQPPGQEEVEVPTENQAGRLTLPALSEAQSPDAT